MRKTRSRLVTVGILAGLLLSVLIGSAIGKYTTTVPVSGTVTFHADLGTITLQEHAAVRQPDGSYALVTAEYAQADTTDAYNEETFVNSNGYTLLPGLDIPKDPHIVIENKTPIEAYLFVEVVESGDVGLQDKVITYALTDDWLKLEDVNGKNGGTVYVYKGTGTSAKELDHNINSPWTVQILAPLPEDNNSHIRVSQKLITTPSTGDDVLKFYACMGETAMGADAAAVYKAIHNIT